MATFRRIVLFLSMLLPWDGISARSFSAEAALVEDMDGDALRLRLRGETPSFTIHRHDRIQSGHRFGAGAERIQWSGLAGTMAEVAYALPRAPVIEELTLAAHLQSSRYGVQLGVVVALPRSVDAQTGRPRELLLRGSVASHDGPWLRLVLDDLPAALTRRVRVARAQHNAPIDERGAYVTQLVLLLPGGSGPATVVVDRLELDGAVDPRTQSTTAEAAPLAGSPSPVSGTGLSGRAQTLQPPFRILEWQGEPFPLVAKLGFDAVRIGRLPTPDETEAARQQGLSIVCPPPLQSQIVQDGIDNSYSNVAAWEIGEELTEADLDVAERLRRLIRQYDPVADRPTLLASGRFTRQASRIAEILLLERPLLGSSLTLRDYATWLGQRQRLARPGTPFWVRIDTELGPHQANQLRALAPLAEELGIASSAHLTSVLSAALTVQPRAFVFGSHRSLVGEDRVARMRRHALQLINLRLGLIRPWLDHGKLLVGARTSQADMTALVMQAERSHLLLPIRWSDSAGGRSAKSRMEPISLVVPGVAESSDAYLLSLSGPKRLRHRRVTGGVRIELDTLEADSLILLTDDQKAFSQVARAIRRQAPEALRLRRELVALRLGASHLQPTKPSDASTEPEWQAEARQHLKACDQSLAKKDLEAALHHTNTAQRVLDSQHESLGEESSLDCSACSTPLDLAPVMRRQWEQSLASLPQGANLLIGGAFEDLSALLHAGWRHRQLPTEGIDSSVRLAPSDAPSGGHCLELEAQASQSPLRVVGNAPVWITSAPVRVSAGQCVEITGVARVPHELTGSVEGLQILDSIGGSSMALRIRHAPSWRPFRLLRAVTTDTDVSVTIALSGLGIAQVDDLAIRTYRMPQPMTASRR